MKMIASTRLAKAQRAMQNGKQYGIANSGMIPFRHTLLGTLTGTICICRGLPER
jgi:hypothetical protein